MAGDSIVVSIICIIQSCKPLKSKKNESLLANIDLKHPTVSYPVARWGSAFQASWHSDSPQPTNTPVWLPRTLWKFTPGISRCHWDWVLYINRDRKPFIILMMYKRHKTPKINKFYKLEVGLLYTFKLQSVKKSNSKCHIWIISDVHLDKSFVHLENLY